MYLPSRNPAIEAIFTILPPLPPLATDILSMANQVPWQTPYNIMSRLFCQFAKSPALFTKRVTWESKVCSAWVHRLCQSSACATSHLKAQSI